MCAILNRKKNKNRIEASRKWFRTNLGLDEQYDLDIVSAFAQRLSPGICTPIMDEEVAIEENFIELFEGFV